MNVQVKTNDLCAFWMPFTANRQFKAAPRLVRFGEGYALRHARRPQGSRRHVPGSGASTPGTARPRIVEAIQKQAAELDVAPHLPDGPPEGVRGRRRAWSTIALRASTMCSSPTRARKSVETRAQDRHRLSPRQGQRLEGAPHRPRARLPRRQPRRHGRRRHHPQPQDRFGALDGRRRSPAAHARPVEGNAFSRGEPEHGAELADDLERACRPA